MATVEQTPVQHRIPRSRSERLADQAATAALYVTHPERSASLRSPIRATEIDPAVLRASGSQPGLSNASAAAALLAHARKQEHGAKQAVSPSHETNHRRATSSINDGYQYHAALAALKEQKTPEYYSNRRRAETAPSEAARAGATARVGATTESVADPFDDLDKYMNASRIKNAHLNPKLFTATPPVPAEVEELRRRSILEAASMSMAKDMYGTVDARGGRAAGVRTRRSASASKPQAATLQQASTNVLGQALNLHDVAQKRAAQRIAGLEDETAAFRDYYGIEPQVQRSSLTVRKRRGSDDTEEFDAERSKEIRTQMTALRSKLDAVDERREKDRASLMELARKNVDAAIQDIDKRMYAEPGQSVAMQKYLDEKATQRARKGLEDVDKQTLLADTVNIGGSKYVEMGDVEDLARSRLQPTFDEIDDRAQTQRARDLEARLDEEQKQRLAQLEHEREADIKAEEAKHQDFLKKKQHENKHKADTVWPWKRKSRQLPHDESEVDKTTTERPTERETTEAAAVPSEAAQRQTEETTASEGDSVLRRESKFRNWFKDRIGRRSSAPPPRETNGIHEEQTAQDTAAVTGVGAVTGTGGSERVERVERAEGPERAEGAEREEAADRRGRVFQTDDSEDEYESAAEPATQASRAPKDTLRTAPLRSNPVTAKDLRGPPNFGGVSDDDLSKLNGMSPSEYVAVEQDSKDIVKQSESTKHTGYSAGPDDELTAPSKEREAARESAAQHSLPAPPTIREVGGSTRRASHSTSVRESRFSEDL